MLATLATISEVPTPRLLATPAERPKPKSHRVPDAQGIFGATVIGADASQPIRLLRGLIQASAPARLRCLKPWRNAPG
jgi:hypothetical protein